MEESVSTESTATRVTARKDSLENSVVRTLKGQRVCFGDTFSWTVKAFWQNRNSKNSIREVKFDPPLYRSSIPLWNTFWFALGVQGFFFLFLNLLFSYFCYLCSTSLISSTDFQSETESLLLPTKQLKARLCHEIQTLLCTYTYLSPFENVRGKKFLASVVAHYYLYYNSKTEK